jgi:hypothetical protein
MLPFFPPIPPPKILPIRMKKETDLHFDEVTSFFPLGI